MLEGDGVTCESELGCCNSLAFHARSVYTCVDINECEATPCDQNAMCMDIVGSFTCSCAQGFIGNGMQCQGELTKYPSPPYSFLSNTIDLNECVEAARRGEDICDTVTTSRYCMNTAGSYMCVCPSGTEFKGDQCINSGMFIAMYIMI